MVAFRKILLSEVKWSEVAQSCPTLCNPMDCSLPVFSVHGIFQPRILEWVAISFSRESPRPRDRTQVSCIVGRCFTLWATREVPLKLHWWPISPHSDNHHVCDFSPPLCVSPLCFLLQQKISFLLWKVWPDFWFRKITSKYLHASKLVIKHQNIVNCQSILLKFLQAYILLKFSIFFLKHYPI